MPDLPPSGPPPRLLDLFCGAGGAAMGYRRAGFQVVGVDHRPQKHYPFDFHQADALEYCAEHGHEYDAIHASPPCQRYSVCTPLKYRAGHPDLIGVTRNALISSGVFYIIENVENARRLLINPVNLCGSMFGLRIWRHRFFETSFPVFQMLPPCNHGFIPVLITGTTRRRGYARKDTPVAVRRIAIGIPWMTTTELDDAIPPAYTEWIGSRLMVCIQPDAPPPATSPPAPGL